MNRFKKLKCGASVKFDNDGTFYLKPGYPHEIGIDDKGVLRIEVSSKGLLEILQLACGWAIEDQSGPY